MMPVDLYAINVIIDKILVSSKTLQIKAIAPHEMV